MLNVFMDLDTSIKNIIVRSGERVPLNNCVKVIYILMSITAISFSYTELSILCGKHKKIDN